MPEHEPPNRRAALLALLAIVALVAGGAWLAQRMHANAKLEDCLMQHRTNCASFH